MFLEGGGGSDLTIIDGVRVHAHSVNVITQTPPINRSFSGGDYLVSPDLYWDRGAVLADREPKPEKKPGCSVFLFVGSGGAAQCPLASRVRQYRLMNDCALPNSLRKKTRR